MTKSDALAAHVRRRIEKLEHLFERIASCHVVFELAGHHHRHGDRYHVSIDLRLPGGELLVDHTPSNERAPATPWTAIDRAFDDADRQLEDWVRRGRAHRRNNAPVS